MTRLKETLDRAWAEAPSHPDLQMCLRAGLSEICCSGNRASASRGYISGPTEREVDGFAAHFYDDLQTLDRLIERFGMPPSLRAFAQICSVL